MSTFGFRHSTFGWNLSPGLRPDAVAGSRRPNAERRYDAM